MNTVLLQRSPAWWAAAVATCGNLAIGFGAFWLSFTALSDLARMAGVPEEQAWVWAVIVDGLIVISTVAVVALDGNGWRAVAYPWTLLALSAGVSVVANVLHAIVQAAPEVPAPLAGAIAAVPPLVLISTTHLTVILIRHAGRTTPATQEREAAMPGEPLTAPITMPPPPAPVPDPAQTETSDPAPAPAPAPVEGTPARVSPARVPSTMSRPALRARAQELSEQGWSSRQIADEIKVHRSTVSRWVAPAERTHDTGDFAGAE